MMLAITEEDLSPRRAATTVTSCPKAQKALTISRTWTEAPFVPWTGMPLSAETYAIFIAGWLRTW